jgi:activator of HSP90 ATPase
MKDIKKYYLLPATASELYAALTNPATIQLWTGATAIMSTVPGSEFSLWNGDIVGNNISFVTNQMITQQWYFDDQETTSIVTIKIHPHKTGVSVELRHTNIPDEVYEEMLQGWDEMYFGSLAEFYA